MLEFVQRQHAFGNSGGVQPIDALAAVQLVERLQVIPALQGQDRAFALDPAFGFKVFEIEVRRSPVAPRFILREGLGGLGIRSRRGSFIALTHGQLGPQPPRQAALASVLEKGLGAGEIALLIVHRGQPVRIVEATARAVLQQLDQFLLIRRLLIE
ncbi:hypothetical protein D3C84_715110 [compost metagenome]